MRHGRRAAGVVLVTALGASLAGCGGSDEPTSTGPTSAAPSASPSESATPSPSASPTATTPALSRFEDQPAVQAARAWAAAVGRDVNNGDHGFATAKPLTVPASRKLIDTYAGEDITKKLQYPGPLPFTPVRVREAGNTVTIVSCLWSSGWGLDPATQKPKDKRVILGADFVMQKSGTAWLLKRNDVNGIDCSKVNVKGVPW